MRQTVFQVRCKPPGIHFSEGDYVLKASMINGKPSISQYYVERIDDNSIKLRGVFPDGSISRNAININRKDSQDLELNYAANRNKEQFAQ